MIGRGNRKAGHLAPFDFWTDQMFFSTTAADQVFTGAAVASGTNNTALPVAALLGFNPHGVFLRSSTTAGGGYRYSTASVAADVFGQISHKMQAQFLWRSDFTGRIVRAGYLDTITAADATDGAYFEINGATAVGKTANNNARTEAPASIELALNVAYTFDIEVNAEATQARFRIYQANNSVPIYDQVITTNIPTSTARGFGAGLVATEASTTASDIGIMYRLGLGTVAGFERLRGKG